MWEPAGNTQLSPIAKVSKPEQTKPDFEQPVKNTLSSEQYSITPSSKSAGSRVLSKFDEYPWFYEVQASFFALVAIISILATLFVHQGQPIPQWPIVVSINTLVSICSAVLKGCLAYIVYSCVGQLRWVWFGTGPRPLQDIIRTQDAGTGGWESWTWLWTSRVTQQPFISLAAFLAISTIAIDPFMQQLIRPTDCETRSSQEIATLPRTSYCGGGGLEQEQIPSLEDTVFMSTFTVPQKLQGTCPTGNCTFPTFSTAGYCSACEDVSSSLSFRYTCGEEKFSTQFGGENSETEGPINDSIRSACKESFAAGNATILSKLSSGLNTSNLYTRGSNGGMNLLTSRWRVGLDDSDLPLIYELIKGQTPFSAMGTHPDTGEPVENCADTDDNDWRCRGYGAARCLLYPCVRTYQTSIQNGVVDEKMVDYTRFEDLDSIPYWTQGLFWSQRSFIWPSPDLWLLADTQCTSTAENKELAARGLDINRRWVAFNMSRLEFDPEIAESSKFPASLLARNCAFMWSRKTFTSLVGKQLPSYFMTGDIRGTVIVNGIRNDHNFTSISPFSGPRELLKLYGNNSLTFSSTQDTLDNIATALTQYVRLHGERNYSKPEEGIAWHYAICLEVRWYWIAMPITLLIGVSALLCFTVLSTSYNATPIWKSSPLPLVFRGPYTDNDQAAEDLDNVVKADSISDMERTAAGVVVQLDYSNGIASIRKMNKLVHG